MSKQYFKITIVSYNNMNRSSCFIVGVKTAKYLQKLMYEAELESYKKSKRKKKHEKC